MVFKDFRLHGARLVFTLVWGIKRSARDAVSKLSSVTLAYTSCTRTWSLNLEGDRDDLIPH